MTKLGTPTKASRNAGGGLQSLDDALLALVPAKHREAARILMRMKAEFTPYQHAVADAVEWCVRRQSNSSDKLGPIIKAAAAIFGVEENSIDRVWIHRRWQPLNELLRLRKALRLHQSVESISNDSNRD